MSICFACEILLVKVLTNLAVNGDHAGMFYTFFVGIQGAILLTIYGITGRMKDEIYTIQDYLLILLGGVCEACGIMS